MDLQPDREKLTWQDSKISEYVLVFSAVILWIMVIVEINYYF